MLAAGDNRNAGAGAWGMCGLPGHPFMDAT